jgi:hypothetical protein
LTVEWEYMKCIELESSLGRTNALSLKSTLRLMRLSPARYHAWKRADKRCELVLSIVDERRDRPTTREQVRADQF